MVPQIIYVGMLLIDLIIIGNRHGKEKKGKYNIWADLITLGLGAGLLYWGGFFDKLIQ